MVRGRSVPPHTRRVSDFVRGGWGWVGDTGRNWYDRLSPRDQGILKGNFADGL